MTDIAKSISTPTHIAIIMDGNRRWAKEHNLPVIEGHRRVANDILEPLVEHAAKRGVKYLTFWAWSTENWKRKEQEVSGIMQLFRFVISKQLQRLHEKGVRIKIIGDIKGFDRDIQDRLKQAVEATKDNATITTVFALNYGGRDEIVRAVHTMLEHETSVLETRDITKDTISKYLDTAGIPDPELVIRTGGEQRLSGFLLWQTEYSEFYFPSWYMPDFTTDKLDESIEEYEHRKRNFGV